MSNIKSDNVLLARIRNGNNGGEGEADRTMKFIYHAPLFVGQEMLRAPVYIRKRNAGRKTGSPPSSVPPPLPPSLFLHLDFTRRKRKQTD